MNHLSIIKPKYNTGISNGQLEGRAVINSVKYLKELAGIFKDEQAFTISDGYEAVYKVQAITPVNKGVEGGLFYGITVINPGKVGNEYYMTKGHSHQKEERAEFYWGIQGEGLLLLMDKDRNSWAEKMFPGSLHYINANIAHRTANTGNTPLRFGACWPSDAGHNYQEIIDKGFSARVLDVDGKPTLVSSK